MASARPAVAGRLGRRLPGRLGGRLPSVLGLTAGLALVAATVAGIVVALSEGGSPSPAASARLGRVVSQTDFEERTGIRVVRLAITGGGGLIDFRYQVIDPDKALVIHSPARKPALVDEETGQVFDNIWGHYHGPKQFTAGRTYFFLFVNPRGAIEPNGRASVRIGDSLLEHVPVQ